MPSLLRRTLPLLACFVCALSVGVAAWSWDETLDRSFRLTSLLEDLIQATSERPKIIKMNPDHCDQWSYETENGGIATKAIYTTCGQGGGVPPNESEADCAARHARKVAQAMQQCPPLGPGGSAVDGGDD